MPKYSNERVNISDLNMLREILSSSNKKLETDIIDTLSDIYTLSVEFTNNEDMIKKNYKFMLNTLGNLVKSSIFSVASYVFIINYLDKDPEMMYSFFSCFIPTMVGYRLFQKDNISDNYIDEETLRKVAEDNLNLTTQLLECVDVYFENMMLYLGKNTNSIKEEVKKIFDNNNKYIESNIKNGRFLEDFSYETVLEVANVYLDDEMFKKYVSFCENEQKQRRR